MILKSNKNNKAARAEGKYLFGLSGQKHGTETLINFPSLPTMHVYEAWLTKLCRKGENRSTGNQESEAFPELEMIYVASIFQEPSFYLK